MNFRQRTYRQELLDRNDIPFADIRQNMRELDFINTWLGGHAITLAGLKKLIGGIQPVRICEIGCGGGDNLRALQSWCRRKSIEASFIGIDINPDCIAVAAELKVSTGWQLINSDYRAVQFDQAPDIIFSSLFCHHFTEAELVGQLQWMQQHARIGFFINDLHRHVLAYHSIKWLTRIFSRSYLVKHDAPLSVARSFVKKEWAALFEQAGITNFSIGWRWAFRWLIVVHSRGYAELNE